MTNHTIMFMRPSKISLLNQNSLASVEFQNLVSVENASFDAKVVGLS